MDTELSTGKNAQNGLTVKAYRSDGAVLLGYDLDQTLTPGLAGFALQCTQPDGKSYYIPNRLSFSTAVTAQTAPDEAPVEPSDKAPIQKFHWVFYPSEVQPGAYTYTVTAMYLNPDGSLRAGPSTAVQVATGPVQNGPVKIGFTRGFLSSQAYVDRFGNKPFSPQKSSYASTTAPYFDTAPYQAQYQWLGASARVMMNAFLDECLQDPTVTVDLFAYDLDEPDIIHKLVQMGSRLRAVLDDAPLHTGPGAIEPSAHAALQQSAGADHIKIGHFNRFSHSKVLIKKTNGQPVKVLAGSANFSVRGLYVQANNVFIFDSPEMAAHYEAAFNAAFTNMSGFRSQPVAQQWFDLAGDGFTPYSACFSPHTDPDLSLGKVSKAILGAQSSVLFAVMELEGGGDVMADLLSPGDHPNVFSYGITQSSAGMKLYKPGTAEAVLTPFQALDKHVPPPFRQEWNGGMGQVIHHKFVVVDFNGPNPVLFTGSSNLAKGGEADNGDNLVAIYDPVLVQAYAVEAIRLVDHYHFRTAQEQSTADAPLTLQGVVPAGQEWWRAYYDPTNIKCVERTLFVQ